MVVFWEVVMMGEVTVVAIPNHVSDPGGSLPNEKDLREIFSPFWKLSVTGKQGVGVCVCRQAACPSQRQYFSGWVFGNGAVRSRKVQSPVLKVSVSVVFSVSLLVWLQHIIKLIKLLSPVWAGYYRVFSLIVTYLRIVGTGNDFKEGILKELPLFEHLFGWSVLLYVMKAANKM